MMISSNFPEGGACLELPTQKLLFRMGAPGTLCYASCIRVDQEYT